MQLVTSSAALLPGPQSLQGLMSRGVLPHPTVWHGCSSVALCDGGQRKVESHAVAAIDHMRIHFHQLLVSLQLTRTHFAAGCDAPASQDKVWQCSMQPACAGGDHVMYGWGRGADAMHLPPGTSFSVGPGTAVAHVVLQVVPCHISSSHRNLRQAIANVFRDASGKVVTDSQCRMVSQPSQHLALSKGFLPDACPKNFAESLDKRCTMGIRKTIKWRVREIGFHKSANTGCINPATQET